MYYSLFIVNEIFLYFVKRPQCFFYPKYDKRMKPNHFDTSMGTLIPEYDCFFILIFLCVFRVRKTKSL